MTSLKHVWRADEFDAVNIRAGGCKLYLEGTDDDMVSLEGDLDEKRFRGVRLDKEGRWLRISVSRDQSSGLVLKLPRNKAWVTDVFIGKGEIQARGICSRRQIMVGNGDIFIEDLRGMLTLASGRANIHLKHFTQDIVPPPPPTDEGSPDEPTNKTPWDWLSWRDAEWESWGEGLGERLGWWALDFSRFFDRSDVNVKNAAFSVHTGNGNLEATDINSGTGLFRISNGNLKLQEARIANLNMTLSHGNIEGRSLAPAGNWSIKSTHGNIRLSFASNISARLDMATRNGSIHSEIPLVRVTRQGPETYYGKRMVGTIGPAEEGTLPELRIVATHGNIDVDSRSPENKPDSGPETEKEKVPLVTGITVKATGAARIEQTPSCQKTIDNTPQAILEALREGRISITEAEELLKSMSL